MFLFSYLVEHNRYANIIGIFVVFFLLWLCSRNRSQINYRLVLNGLVLQFLIGFCVLRTSIGHYLLSKVASAVSALYLCAGEGAQFVFGNLTNAADSWGFIFAVKVLPIIIFFGAFMELLFYCGVVQKVINSVSIFIRPLLNTSGAETLCAIANSFLGQTEAPLLIRNYLHNMTRSEVLVVMISGMATISGAILVVFAAMGVPTIHLLSSSVMAIPASIIVAKILYPESENPNTRAGAHITFTHTSQNVLDAIATGTIAGLQLALNVGAMLISFLALIALLNYGLAYLSTCINFLAAYFSSTWHMPTMSIQLIFSYIFAPFGYLLGFSGHEALAAGELIGTKVAINELVAYDAMMHMHLSERAINILTYALCGFSNFSCIGIQIGGIGALMPEKRTWLTEFGLLAVFGGTLANILSAMVAGLLL
jgi:CNT family concentrative nucleoside transporter